MAKRPPRGYQAMEYPLPHNHEGQIELQGDDDTKNSTIIPILRYTEALNDAPSVFANPSHASFAEEAGVSCHPNSIVPRISFKMSAMIPKEAIVTDTLRSTRFYWCPIYTAFLNTLEAEDVKTAVQIEDILELTHNTDNKDVHPLYSSVNINGTPVPMNTVGATEVFGDWGLAANTQVESVAFDEPLMWDAMQYYSNGAMLKKVLGNWRSQSVYTDRNFNYFSHNLTNPTVKRMNPYTFCGILFHLPQAGTSGSYQNADEVTQIDHVRITYTIRYDEWNSGFTQDAF